MGATVKAKAFYGIPKNYTPQIIYYTPQIETLLNLKPVSLPQAQVLAWEGVVGTEGRWHSRWLTVWRGRVYVSRERTDTEALTSRWAPPAPGC